jgi:hypothetical protein
VWKVADPWRALPTTVAGSTVIWQLTDGGENDEDGAANGTIVDPSGAGRIVPFAAVPVEVPVPINGPWALLLMLLLMATVGAARLRRN